MTTQSINLPKQTKYYSSLLYRLSDELLRHDYDPVSPDEVAEAA